MGAFLRADQPWGDAELAQLYDAFSFDADLPLYRRLAAAEGGRVLEIACGTGRVLVPLARAGFSVVGVDISRPMLELARAKLGHDHQRVELVQADMRTFTLQSPPFDLAILAVKSFCYLTERADQLRCLERIAAHLRPRGLLVIDLLHPRPDWVGAPVGWLRDDLVQSAMGNGSMLTVSRVESVVSTDLARQVRTIRSTYEVIDMHGRPVAKRYVEWPYRYTHRFEAEHLLERAGFEIEAVHGGYAGEPLSNDSPTMLFLARRGA
jgi:SAM-dependent methyltransferase